jgi:hypothetical protein
MSTTPEGKVKLALKKMLKEEFPQVWTYWPVSNGMGAHGIPDLIMCAGGLFIGAEVKAPGKKVTLLQANQLQMIESAQGTPMILVGDEAVATLRAFLSCLHLPRADPASFKLPVFQARLTQAEYDALPVKDPQTLYNIVDASL